MPLDKSAFSDEEGRQLLAIACASIDHGLEHGSPLRVDLESFPPSFHEHRATFATLETASGALRGCIGTLEAVRPVAEDVARHAYAAAFEDPRFPPVTNKEWPGLILHLSILSPAEPFPVDSEDDACRQLRPGVDGLILEEGRACATFLPSVWDELSDPKDFMRYLKRKAGLPEPYWSDAIRLYRYTTQIIPADACTD